MSNRQNIASGGKWEEAFGYSRAVRVGAMVFVSGCTSADNAGNVRGESDAYAQARLALQTLEAALNAAGALTDSVVRTRIFVVDIARDGEAVGRAHGEFFGYIRPAATMVEVRALIDPAMLVEIEADAIITG